MPAMSDAAIALRGVTKVYDNGTVALGPLDLTVRHGEFVSLLGASGCGKSTALRIIAGLTQASGGLVDVATRSGHTIGFVFQEPTLMPWCNVRDNVRLPLKLAHVATRESDARVMEALAQVGLADFASSYPRELSGGMKMRVSLARALVTDPDILLMDEPFAALDALTREDLSLELQRIWSEHRKTIVFVTHSIQEAVVLSDRVIVMTPRPGRVAREIAVDTARPRDFSSVERDAGVQAATDEVRELLFERHAGEAA